MDETRNRSLCIAQWPRAGHEPKPQPRERLFPALDGYDYEGFPDGTCSKCGMVEHAPTCAHVRPVSPPQPAKPESDCSRPGWRKEGTVIDGKDCWCNDQLVGYGAAVWSKCQGDWFIGSPGGLLRNASLSALMLECEQRSGITPREHAKPPAPAQASAFKPGDRVRCINDIGAVNDPDCVKNGCEYTIASVNGSFVSTTELPGPFCAWRFVLAAQEHVERECGAGGREATGLRPGWSRQDHGPNGREKYVGFDNQILYGGTFSDGRSWLVYLPFSDMRRYATPEEAMLVAEQNGRRS